MIHHSAPLPLLQESLVSDLNSSLALKSRKTMRQLSKAITCFLFLIIHAKSIELKAQNSFLKIGFLNPGVNRSMVVQKENSFLRNNSVALSAFFLQSNDQTISGVGISPEYRRYFFSESFIRSFFIGSFFQYFNYKSSAQSKNGSGDTFSVGGLIGKRLFVSNKFLIEGFIGPSLNYNLSKTTDTVISNNPISRIKFGLMVGLATRKRNCACDK